MLSGTILKAKPKIQHPGREFIRIRDISQLTHYLLALWEMIARLKEIIINLYPL